MPFQMGGDKITKHLILQFSQTRLPYHNDAEASIHDHINTGHREVQNEMHGFEKPGKVGDGIAEERGRAGKEGTLLSRG